ncbi:hypothetical protein ACFLSA_05050 [Bacteroidota bacterium]
MIKILNYDDVLKWSYPLAKKWIIENLVNRGIDSSRKFEAYKKSGNYLPKRFPKRPDDYFRLRGTWKGWNDFFGNPTHSVKKNFYNYTTASLITRKAGIQNSTEFKKWIERPDKIPSRPDQFYKEVWKGWEHFLGEKYKLPKPKNFCKLSETDVKIIKHQLSLGVTGAALAKHFKVSEMQISRIKHRENWNDVEI